MFSVYAENVNITTVLFRPIIPKTLQLAYKLFVRYFVFPWASGQVKYLAYKLFYFVSLRVGEWAS